MNVRRAICIEAVILLVGYWPALAQTQPEQPVNISPCGVTDESLTPTLQASPFSDPDGDSHWVSTWQVNTTPDFYSPPYYVWDSGQTSSGLTSIIVPHGYLNPNTIYFWRVIYRASDASWSEWSAPCSFQTGEGSTACANVWCFGVPMQYGRSAFGATVGGDGRIYVIGGRNDSSGNTASAECFNEATQEWTTIASPYSQPMPRTCMATDGHGRVYAIGGKVQGDTLIDNVYRYDPVANSWEEVSPLPAPGVGEAVTDLEGRIYFVGGNDAVRGNARVYRYIPDSDTWEIMPSLNEGRDFHAALRAPDGRIYVLGGGSTSELASVERFDPLQPELGWSYVTSIEVARQTQGTVGQDGRFYLAGGWLPGYTSMVEIYDPLSGEFSSYTSMNRATNNFALVTAASGRIYALGGDFGQTTVEYSDPLPAEGEGEGEGEFSGMVWGVVRDAFTGDAIAGAEVSLYESQTGALLDATSSGIDGGYTVYASDVQVSLTLRVEKAEYDPRQISGFLAPRNLDVILILRTPSAPTGLVAMSGASGVTLRWQANPESDLAGYNAYRESAVKDFVRINVEPIATPSYFDTPPAGGVYRYFVTAIDKEAHESSGSNVAEVEEGVIIMWLSNVTGAPGGQVRVQLNVINAVGVNPSGIDIDFRYPVELLGAGSVRVERTAITADTSPIVNAAEPGRVRISSIGEAQTLVGQGHLFDVYIPIREDAPSGTCGDIYFASVNLYDDSVPPQALPVDSSSTASLCAGTACTQGDLNNDMLVNSADVLIVLQVAAGKITSSPCILQAGDLNGDGIIDSADAVLIQRLAVGLPLNPSEGNREAAMRRDSTGNSPKDNTILVYAGTSTVSPGDVATIPISVTEGAGIAGIDLVVAFPAEALSLVAVSRGSLTRDSRYAVRVDAGVARLSMAQAGGLVSGSGTIALLDFRVPETAPPGAMYAIAINDVSLKGQYGDDLQWMNVIEIQNGLVAIEESPCHNNPELCRQPRGGLYRVGDDLCLSVPCPVSQFSSYQWSKDGAPLMHGGRVSGVSDRVLRITGLIESDTGIYTCIYDDGNKQPVSFSARVIVAEALPATGAAHAVVLMLVLGFLTVLLLRRFAA